MRAPRPAIRLLSARGTRKTARGRGGPDPLFILRFFAFVSHSRVRTSFHTSAPILFSSTTVCPREPRKPRRPRHFFIIIISFLFNSFLLVRPEDIRSTRRTPVTRVAAESHRGFFHIHRERGERAERRKRSRADRDSPRGRKRVWRTFAGFSRYLLTKPHKFFAVLANGSSLSKFGRQGAEPRGRATRNEPATICRSSRGRRFVIALKSRESPRPIVNLSALSLRIC